MNDPIRRIHQRSVTAVLLVVLLFALVALGSGMRSWRFPGNERGYAPKQPIDYSHRLHAGDLKINCQFCHSAAGKSRYAGIPSANVCMKCHNIVTNSYEAMLSAKKNPQDKEKQQPSAELAKLYQSLDLDEKLQPKPDAKPQSIEWVRVHNLPEFAFFSHRAHVTAGVECQRCHGPVESMQRIRQVESLSMGWCVNCHREVNEKGVAGKSVDASTSCSTCHF